MNATSFGITLRMNRERILKWAGVCKLLLAGALCGIAVVNTIALVLGNQPPSDSAEKLSMGIGAAVFAALLKITHIL
jgi:hypothetical protein